VTHAPAEAARLLSALGVVVFERGWLSANNLLFLPRDGGPGTVVDTGYSLHEEQTAQLLRSRLGSRGLRRIVNTHLHSDHCGGNARLQREFGCEISVPAASFDAVTRWDQGRLTFRRTDQRCDPFPVHSAIHPGQSVRLGDHDWQAHATPGHDPDALVFFQPDTGVLIAGDALWQDRLAIVFPELAGEDGFSAVRRTLGLIENLRPRVVVPGHGTPFTEVSEAIAASRHRLEAFERMPERHLAYALRALIMFHMLERRERPYADLVAWAAVAPILQGGMLRAGVPADQVSNVVQETVERLLSSGALRRSGESICIAREGRE
jgi:glyoxylase-like metal-dependent hydrolase (beta-lactamase superfamily II)